MKIFLTFDYELFFGSDSGTVEKCLLAPTNRLLSLAKKHGASFTFFIDTGYLIQVEEYAPLYPALKDDLDKVKIQIKRIVSEGHSIGLHVHPHWEKSYYVDGKWHMFTQGTYKLADFSDEEIVSIMTRYKTYLDQLTGQTSNIFRAGGWCIQPFHRLHDIFKELDIQLDSSVMPGASYSAGEYAYDFSHAPQTSHYRFEEDVCVEKKDGFFMEYPIASLSYSPIFYWKLYMLGRMFPREHKMLGDGHFLAQPGRKWHQLTASTITHVSTDGYYASQLKKSVHKFEKRGHLSMVTIGHPKSMTEYSFKKLDQFLSSACKKHSFHSLSEVF